jgi:hypothetical protein
MTHVAPQVVVTVRGVVLRTKEVQTGLKKVSTLDINQTLKAVLPLSSPGQADIIELQVINSQNSSLVRLFVIIVLVIALVIAVIRDHNIGSLGLNIRKNEFCC